MMPAIRRWACVVVPMFKCSLCLVSIGFGGDVDEPYVWGALHGRAVHENGTAVPELGIAVRVIWL